MLTHGMVVRALLYGLIDESLLLANLEYGVCLVGDSLLVGLLGGVEGVRGG